MNASLRLDAVDRLALGFLGLGTSLFVVGLLVDPQALTQVLRTIVDEWTPGFVIDGLLLLAHASAPSSLAPGATRIPSSRSRTTV